MGNGGLGNGEWEFEILFGRRKKEEVRARLSGGEKGEYGREAG